MFKSIQESVKSLLSTSTNDKDRPSGTKRKHSLSEDLTNDGPEVKIIKVEGEKRKTESQTPLWSLAHLSSKMANWVRLKSKMFSDQFENVDMSKRHLPRDTTSKRNGVPSRTAHNRNRGRPDVVISQPRTGFTTAATGHDVIKEGGMMNFNTSQVNGDRRSSTSSFCRQGYSRSTGLSSIRLGEKEKYEKLLKLQSRFSASTSPSRMTLTSKESDVPSGSSDSWCDDSVLGNKSIFNLSRQPSDTSITASRFKPIPARTFVVPLAQDTRERHQKLNSADLRNRVAPLIAYQKRQAELRLTSSQVQLQSKSSHSKENVVVIDDDDDVIVVPDRGLKSSEINKSLSNDNVNNGLSPKSQHKSLDFRDSPYLEAHYTEKLKNSRLMHCEQWRRQVEEEQMKARAYEEKRRAQNLDLERRLKYQMRIFEQEPEVSEEIFFEEEEEEVEEVLPELTESMMKVVRSALGHGPPGEILSDGFRLQITRKDISTLAGLNWLNDEVINFYMNMLMERGEQEGRAKVYAFNTFFYPKIMQGGHGAVRRWTKKVDIFAMHYILIPVHLGMHWCLCVADMKNKKITYYDSMHGRNKDCLTAVLKYINDECVAKKQHPINMTEWTLEVAEDNPQQLNGSDCGMFSCKYAEYITRGSSLSFTQEDMPYFRHRMVYEIITKKLLQ